MDVKQHFNIIRDGAESRRDQEEGGELDSHEEVRLSFAGPGEIKRREVSWTLTKKLDTFAGPGEIKRREVSWTLTKKLDFHLRVQARSRGGR